MALVLALGVGLVFTALFLALAAVVGTRREQVGVGRSLEVLEALTAAPEEMKRELEPSFADRVLLPLLARAQVLGRRLTPSDAGGRIREKLERAGNPTGWTVERVVAGKAVGFCAALVVATAACALAGSSFVVMLLVVVLASLLGYHAPNLYLYQRTYDRNAAIGRELSDAIDLLTISVESGLGFDSAVSHVARNTEGPLADEFARMLQEMQIGRSRADALRSLGQRCDLPEVRAFCGAMVQADSFGIPVGQVLRVQSSEIRTKRRQKAEEKAQQVPIKIMPPLIFCILPCLFIAVLGPAGISLMTEFTGRV